jgi:transcription elongation factor Elf1
MSSEKYHSEIVDLPSKGKFYPSGHPLSSGQVELKYLTAKEEDILTSTNLIQKGVVLDKLMDSIILTKGVTHEDLLLGDLNAVMVASRILGYGKDYPLTVTCPKCNTTTEHNVDLSQLETKEVPENDLTVKLPVSGKTIKVRLLTRRIEKDIQKELDSLKKIGSSVEPEATTRLRYLIAEVDGVTDQKTIRETVENMLVRDTKALREFYRSVTPDVKFESQFMCSICNTETVLPISIGLNFFWPDARV